MKPMSLFAEHDFLLGGGEMGELIRATDWSSTPVGGVETWPQSLRTAVSIMLNSQFPMYIAWGKEFTQFYNDGYRPILGSTKHPAAMGKSTKFTFSEIWEIIGPMFEGVMKGKAVGFTDFMLPLDRHGFTEECYFIFSYSPIKQEDGFTGGVLVTVTETTDRVLGERRLRTLRELGDRTYQCKNLSEAAVCVLDVLNNNRLDVPFSLLYSYNAEQNKYTFEGSTGIDVEYSARSVDAFVRLAKERPLVCVPIEEVFESIRLADGAPWVEQPQQCCACFLSRPDQSNRFGVLVLGVSPRLKYDAAYQNFFRLLADQVITAFANTNAFEEERKRSEALAELDKAKTAFFSNISHEFRTPLTLMLGPLEELLHYSENLASKHIENVEAAHRNAMRLLKLVNTLLDFSRIESGRIQAEFRRADITMITGDIVSNFRSIIEKAGLQLVTTFGTVSGSVYVDYSMWEKIVLNLLSNAFKYTLQGSITVGLEQHGRNLVLIVKDTGVGIPEEELPHMFERFHRVANSAGRSYEGTGIGLSLVAELVRMHEGTIAVQSKINKGTTFTITIPVGFSHLPQDCVIHEPNNAYSSIVAESFLKEASVLSFADSNKATEGATPQREDGRTKAATVLVVDDNADMLNYLVRILEKRYRVLIASNGAKALEVVAYEKPDLVISDIMMPVMDGIAFMKEVKANRVTSNIPLMLLSARAGEESRIEGYELGADDYLTKPFSAKELLSRVKAQINIAKKRSHLDKLLQQVFEQTPAAITIIRKENYLVEFANSLYLQLVDKGPEFIGRSLFDSMPELRDQVVVQQLLDNVMTTGNPYEGREMEVFLHRQGRRDLTYFNFVYHPFREEDGSISGVIVVCFDVTDLVIAKRRAEKSEQELEAKVKERTAELEEKNALLMKANHELEQFAYVASHDLQEPLRKIRTFSSILEQTFPIDTNARIYFEKIHSSSDRMARLIKDVLEYSRLSKTHLSPQAVDLQAILKSVLTDFELLIEEKRAQIYADDLPTIQGVQLQLQQLFANLISNALKFSKDDPIIKIECKTRSAKEIQAYFSPSAERYFEIGFKDNGIGFDTQYADQIFTIFQRLHDKEISGTGIGLALCKKIVENHGGHIRVESQPGTGSNFIVYLPA